MGAPHSFPPPPGLDDLYEKVVTRFNAEQEEARQYYADRRATNLGIVMAFTWIFLIILMTLAFAIAMSRA